MHNRKKKINTYRHAVPYTLADVLSLCRIVQLYNITVISRNVRLSCGSIPCASHCVWITFHISFHDDFLSRRSEIDVIKPLIVLPHWTTLIVNDGSISLTSRDKDKTFSKVTRLATKWLLCTRDREFLRFEFPYPELCEVSILQRIAYSNGRYNCHAHINIKITFATWK